MLSGVCLGFLKGFFWRLKAWWGGFEVFFPRRFATFEDVWVFLVLVGWLLEQIT